MGTNTETKGLQAEIRALIAELGWTQNKLAKVLYVEMQDWEDEDEIHRFQERLKKELQRTTTPPEKLKKYMGLLVNHPDVQKMTPLLRNGVRLGAISESLSSGIHEISHEIDDLITKRCSE